MADFDWPEGLAPYQMSFHLAHSTRVHESPFTRQRKVYGLAPSRWVARMSLRGMENATAGDIDGLLARLRGPQNRVRVFDYRRPSGRGTITSHDDYAETIPVTYFVGGIRFTDGMGFFVEGTGTPTNLSAAQGATTVQLVNLAPGTIPRKSGDYIGFGDNRCYQAVTDAEVDADGIVTVTFEPPLRAAVTADTVEFANIRATFRLADDNAGNNPTDVNGLSTYEIDLVEDIT